MSLTFFLSRKFLAAFFWAGFALWITILWTLSAGPQLVEEKPGGLPVDKLLHFLYFFGGGVCLFFACLHTFAWRVRSLVFAVVAAMALIGAADEWHQTYTPGRSGGDPGDWAADFAGGLVAAVLAGAIYGRFRKSEEPGT